MTGFLFAFVASFLVSLVVETAPPGFASFRAPARALAFRLALHTVLFLAAFSLSWRPWHAAFVTVTVCGLFGAGSAIKRRILGEPLIFSDFALVRNAIRHPRLYYAERLAEPRALAGFAALIAATAAWFAVEPSILPSGGAILALGPAVLTALLLVALL
ncbi:LTA synthase family protein, partial [Hansschlegelia beijingensis]